MFDPLKIGIYILLFLPGFILVQTKEHHLLREQRPQFEKTLEIILWSAVIWMIAFISPYWIIGFVDERYEVLKALDSVVIKDAKVDHFIDAILKLKKSSAMFFLSVCLWSFFFANVWGFLRKMTKIDELIHWITGRDWYPSVAFRFFKENLNKPVEIKVQGKRYLGILYAAPDCKEDKYIILTDPKLLPKFGSAGVIEPLPLVDYIAIKFDEISQINAYNEDILTKSSDQEGGKKNG